MQIFLNKFYKAFGISKTCIDITYFFLIIETQQHGKQEYDLRTLENIHNLVCFIYFSVDIFISINTKRVLLNLNSI